MLVMKPIFGDLTGFNPFPWLAAALVPLGALIFYARKKLAAATAPGAEEQEQPSPALSSGFVGVLLGVMAAAIVASSLAFIPGVSAAVAGLGLLGKFLLNAGIAFAFPALGYFLDKRIRAKKSGGK